VARRLKAGGSADPVTAYAHGVGDRTILAGPMVRLACARHLKDLDEGPGRGLRWDLASALRAIEFFKDVLVFPDGDRAGQPFVLEPWQKFIVGSLFGWKGPDGNRRFRLAYAETAKGNGKSPLVAGIGIYGLTADGEPGAEIFSAATTRDQAKIVWGDADKMRAASLPLRRLIRRTVNNLAVESTGSFFRPISADASKLDGFRGHMVIVDEVHEHPNAFVIDKMRASFKGRKQPLLLLITNSGYDRNSVCWQYHHYSRQVLEGIIQNDALFAYVCELDEGDDWRDEAVWPKVNPNLGVSVTHKYLREQVQEALDIPAKENIVVRLNFCVWTEQSVRAINMAAWDQGGFDAVRPKTIRQSIDEMATALHGRRCFGGLDLARVCDLSAFVLLFPPEDTDEPWKVLGRFWVPQDDILTRSKRDRVPYDVWTREKYLIPTPGNTTDYSFIEHEILQLAGQYDIQEIAFDRTFAGEIVQNLMSEFGPEGQNGPQMVQFGQGFLSMAAPTAELLRLVKAGQLWHGGHPVLRWNASNFCVATDPAGNLKPDKARSTERIDGIVALCNALGRAMVQAKPEPSVYETRGVLVL